MPKQLTLEERFAKTRDLVKRAQRLAKGTKQEPHVVRVVTQLTAAGRDSEIGQRCLAALKLYVDGGVAMPAAMEEAGLTERAEA